MTYDSNAEHEAFTSITSRCDGPATPFVMACRACKLSAAYPTKAEETANALARALKQYHGIDLDDGCDMPAINTADGYEYPCY